MSAKPRVRVRSGGSIGVVIPIRDVTPDEVWQALDSVGQLAEIGAIDGIAIAATLRDGSVSTCYVVGENVFLMMGALRQIARRVEGDVPVT